MDQSRYTTYSTTRLPKKKRRIALPGSFEDSGKWVRCWNCGFIVNVDRDLGNPEKAGNFETVQILEAVSPVGSGNDPSIGLDVLDQVGTCVKNLSGDIAPDSYYTPRVPQVSRGCPLCGCGNM